MEIKWLEDFLCLCETRSFRSAAERRYVSQPAFSRRIRALESWIGVDLVDRSSYPVQLTISGVEFVDAAKQIIAIAYQTRDDIRDTLHQNSQMVTVATHPSLAVTFVPEFVRKLQPDSGRMGCRIRNDMKNSEQYLTALEQGTCDFLICYDHEALEFLVDERKFLSQPIGTEVLIPVVAERTASLMLEDPVPLIQYAPYTRLGKIVAQFARSACGERSFEIVGEASVAETLKAMVLSGHGMAWLPESMLHREFADATIERCAQFDSIDVGVKIYRHELLRKQAMDLWQRIESAPNPRP